MLKGVNAITMSDSEWLLNEYNEIKSLFCDQEDTVIVEDAAIAKKLIEMIPKEKQNSVDKKIILSHFSRLINKMPITKINSTDGFEILYSVLNYDVYKSIRSDSFFKYHNTKTNEIIFFDRNSIKFFTNLPKYDDSIIPCIITIVHMISPIKFPYALAETPYIYLYGTFTETRKGVLFHLTSIFDERKNNLFYCNIYFNGTKEIGEDDYKRLIEN